MNITDQTLSAFLDAELPEADMAAVRECIASDETLAMRLAELAAVDSQVQAAYSGIDAAPMPAAVTQLLARDEEPAPSATILRFPTLGRQGLAMAASVAFAVGFGLSHWLGLQSAPTDNWPAIAQALESAPSGTSLTLTNGAEITPRVTFTNAQGLMCRQYQALNATEQTQAVACRGADDWRQVAALTTERHDAGIYQTASADNPINAVVEQMAVGAFLNRAEERAAIANHWQAAPTQLDSTRK